MKERTRRLTAALLLAVFAAFACGNTMFTHSHVGADGGVVTHSHPYLPSAHHTHSAALLLTLSAFNGIAFDGGAPRWCVRGYITFSRIQNDSKKYISAAGARGVGSALPCRRAAAGFH